jgi:hypothetical protein
MLGDPGHVPPQRYEPNELLDCDYSITLATQEQASILRAPGLGRVIVIARRQINQGSRPRHRATEARVNCLPMPAFCDPLPGGGSLRKLTPGARAGLEPATLVVNAGSGCSAAISVVVEH